MFLQSSSTMASVLLIYGASVVLALPFVSPDRLAFAVILVPALVWLSQSDLRRHDIPDGAVVIIAATGALFQSWQHGSSPQLFAEFALAGLVTAAVWMAGGLYFNRTGREAIGIGDAKLIGAGTLAVGASSLAAMLLVASVGGIVAGLLTRAKPDGRELSGVPFGPFLAFSIFIFALFPFSEFIQP